MVVSKGAAAGCVLALLSLNGLGCGAEMVRPRASGEQFEARPGRALVVGQLKLDVTDAEDKHLTLTRHRVVVGDDEALFVDEIPTDGRTFALWIYPGVFCLGRPAVGEGENPKLLGKGQPCVEIPEAGQAFYVGSVTWEVRPKGNDLEATLRVEDKRESVAASPQLAGMYPEALLVSTDVDPDKAAKKYKLP